jgi:hypothetical protein
VTPATEREEPELEAGVVLASDLGVVLRVDADAPIELVVVVDLGVVVAVDADAQVELVVVLAVVGAVWGEFKVEGRFDGDAPVCDAFFLEERNPMNDKEWLKY